MAVVVQINPIDWRAVGGVNSLPGADFFEKRIRVRQMNLGHVLHKRAHHFVVANTPVDPAKEHHQLHQGRERHSPPIRVIDDANNFDQGAAPGRNGISRVTGLGSCDQQFAA